MTRANPAQRVLLGGPLDSQWSERDPVIESACGSLTMSRRECADTVVGEVLAAKKTDLAAVAIKGGSCVGAAPL